MVAIFVLTAFLCFIAIDLIVLKVQGKFHPAFEPVFTLAELSIFDRNSFTVPSNIYLSKGHTWIQKTTEGLLNIGVDALGCKALGTLSLTRCAEQGQHLKRGEVLFEGVYGNRKVKFLSPINGEVRAVNPDIIGKKISTPYESWGVKLLPKDFSKKSKVFLSGTDASTWMKNEFIKLKSFLDNHTPKIDLAGATMYDGGSLSNDVVTSLVDESVNDFEKEFLSI